MSSTEERIAKVREAVTKLLDELNSEDRLPSQPKSMSRELRPILHGEYEIELGKQVEAVNRVGTILAKMEDQHISNHSQGKTQDENRYSVISVLKGIRDFLRFSRKGKIYEISVLEHQVSCLNAAKNFLKSNRLLAAQAARHSVEYELDSKTLYGNLIKNSCRRLIFNTSTPVKTLFGLFLALPFYMAICYGSFLALDGFFVLAFGERNAFYAFYRELGINLVVARGTTIDQSQPEGELEEEGEPEEPGIVGEGRLEGNNLVGKVGEQRKQPEEYAEQEVQGIKEFREFQEIYLLTVWVALAGATGSIISIITRIDQYKSYTYSKTFLPIVIGALKPTIGASAGILTLAVISSAIIPVDVPDFDDSEVGTAQIGNEAIGSEDAPLRGKRIFFLYAVAFGAGFSERIFKDIVSQTGSILGSEDDNVQE